MARKKKIVKIKQKQNTNIRIHIDQSKKISRNPVKREPKQSSFPNIQYIPQFLPQFIPQYLDGLRGNFEPRDVKIPEMLKK